MVEYFVKYFLPLVIPLIIIAAFYVTISKSANKDLGIKLTTLPIATPIEDPLSIDFMRRQNYPGSEITIEKTLKDGTNYRRYIASFYSDGLKEYAYFAVPKTDKPEGGFPVIIFNHGYQIPERYTPDGNYISYMDALAREGYVIFKPDYRGNGKSEGRPTSAYFSPDYAIDDLNAIASIKKYMDPETDSELINPDKIGLWGHSMGGNITLRTMVVSHDIKAVVIWGGVVGNYTDIIYNWQDKVSYKPDAEDLYLRNLGLSVLLDKEGTPQENPDFWNSLDPTMNLKYVSAPVQIHAGLSDTQVPPAFSGYLYTKLKDEGKTVEHYEYKGANHDINQSFSLAMKRTIDFYNKYLK